MTPEAATPEVATVTGQVAAFIGTVVGSALAAAILAWRARGKREEKKERLHYVGDSSSQPRLISRKEWHEVVNLVNTIPGITARMRTLENTFAEHARQNTIAMTGLARLEISFASHIERWEEVGIRAAEDRREMRESIADLAKDVKEIRRDMK